MPYDGNSDQTEESGVAEHVDRVRRAHEARLLGVEGVVGVGLGQTSIGDDAIVVYLRDRHAARRLPSDIDGVPVVTNVTGDIDAY